MSAAQLPLFSPSEEAACYHDGSNVGYFATLVQPHHSKKKLQDSYPLSMMPTVLERLDPTRDTWISQAEFFKQTRRVVHLARIGLLFADLDTYKSPWGAAKNKQQQTDGFLYYCQQEGLPPPSIIIYSGRGLQVKWLLDQPVPRAALPRWNACQRYLVRRLEQFGSDAGAKDASRVLRLVETVNSKSGEMCQVMHVERGVDGDPVRYSFEYLAEVLLPLTREEVAAAREARRLKVVAHGTPGNLRRLSGRRLAWDRLEDLRQLATMRGGVTEGERMRHMFWRINFLLLSGCTHSSQMYHEAAALAHELDFSDEYHNHELSTLYNKAKAHEAGKKVEFEGKIWPPLYTPSNATLIDLFQITDHEQRKLRTVISADLSRERDRDRATERRRAAGAMERAIYEANSLSRKKPWEALGMSRASWYRAGKPMPGETSPSVLQESGTFDTKIGGETGPSV